MRGHRRRESLRTFEECGAVGEMSYECGWPKASRDGCVERKRREVAEMRWERESEDQKYES